MTLLGLYLERCNTRHNINEHLPTLKYYAEMCSHVTEFGVDRGWSTSAFLASGCPVVRSYDVARQQDVFMLQSLADTEGVDWKFIQEDTRDAVIEPTDLLFVDTEHTYECVWAELNRHIDKVKRFLVFHDTMSYPEIVAAIAEHTGEGWITLEWRTNQHGLAVLEREL